MDKKQYLELRNALLAAVEGLISEGKIEESNAKMEEVEALDAKWEEIKLANANLNALKDNTRAIDLADKSVDVEGNIIAEGIVGSKVINEEELYTIAWAKKLLKADMTDEEVKIFNRVNNITNAYTHTTSLTTLIPETVVKGIEKLMVEQFPLLADVRKFNVHGNLTMNKHASIEAGDASWYLEEDPVADEENTFSQFKLSGHELAKAVTVSWKMQSMSVEEFIPFLQAELAERMGIAKATAVVKGAGTDQPTGILTVLESEDETPQIVEFIKSDGIKYADVTTAISKIHSSLLSGVAIYANNTTIWTRLATMVDEMGRPLFIPDVTAGGVGKMFGFVVKAEGSLDDGEILFGNAYKGYYMNTNEPMKLVSEDHAKKRETDFVAYEITDGNVYESKAFALLKEVVGG